MEGLRKEESLSSGMAKPLKESSIFFLAVHMRLLNLGSPVESSNLPPVMRLRRAGKAQSFLLPDYIF